MQARTCTKGVLSGDAQYQYPICAVTVATKPSCGITFLPTAVTLGTPVTLAWDTSNVTSATVDNGVGQISVLPSGSESITVPVSATYTMTVSGPGGTAVCRRAVNVFSSALPKVTGLTSVCGSGGKSAALSWSALPTSSTYGLRIDDTTNNVASCAGGWLCPASSDHQFLFVAPTTLTTTDTIPGAPYRWWVQAETNGVYNAASAISTFSCPATTANATSLSSLASVLMAMQALLQKIEEAGK
jgi:hypothetical protein